MINLCFQLFQVDCVWGCFCAKGYLRNNYNGKCVPEGECRNTKAVDVSPQIPGLFKHLGILGNVFGGGGSNCHGSNCASNYPNYHQNYVPSYPCHGNNCGTSYQNYYIPNYPSNYPCHGSDCGVNYQNYYVPNYQCHGNNCGTNHYVPNYECKGPNCEDLSVGIGFDLI